MLDYGHSGHGSEERYAGEEHQALGEGLGHGRSVAHEAATVDG